jgi:hypothetical protein
MFVSIKGVYRNGKIELLEMPSDVPNDTQVIVTFLQTAENDLKTYGIDEIQAGNLRASLQTFAEDWDDPQMDVYDHYDAAKSNL